MDKGGAKAERGYPGPTRGRQSVNQGHYIQECSGRSAKHGLQMYGPMF